MAENVSLKLTNAYIHTFSHIISHTYIYSIKIYDKACNRIRKIGKILF